MRLISKNQKVNPFPQTLHLIFKEIFFNIRQRFVHNADYSQTYLLDGECLKCPLHLKMLRLPVATQDTGAWFKSANADGEAVSC